MSDRDKARQLREEARRLRREAAEETSRGNGSPMPAENELQPEHHSGALAQAVKVAAAAAAVGAAAGAARAIAERDGGNGGDTEDLHQEEEPQGRVPDEPDEGEDAPEKPDDEPAAEAEQPEPEPDAEQPADEPHPEHEPVAGGTLQETMDVVRRAREQLSALSGREPEGVSALERMPDGWKVTFEAVELARVPDSTDVMASYAVHLDDDLNVVRYARVRRYSRSQAEHEDVT